MSENLGYSRLRTAVSIHSKEKYRKLYEIVSSGESTLVVFMKPNIIFNLKTRVLIFKYFILFRRCYFNFTICFFCSVFY